MLLNSLFDMLPLRFTTQDFTTSWQRQEVWIVTDCTVSVFSSNKFDDEVGKEVEQKSMDETTPSQSFLGRYDSKHKESLSKAIIEAKQTLKDIENIVSLAHIKIKPAKSRNSLLKKGNVTKK